MHEPEEMNGLKTVDECIDMIRTMIRHSREPGMSSRISESKMITNIDKIAKHAQDLLRTSQNNRAKVVTLCGSSKFKDEFIAAQKRLSLEGYIVLSLGLFGHTDSPEVFEDPSIKEMLVRNHKQKIDMSDEIYVINPGGYIGESTLNEIMYAHDHGKIIRYLIQA